MDFTNLKMSFLLKGDVQVTVYQFGNSQVEITKDDENYLFEYTNAGISKIKEFTEDLPKIISKEVINLFNGFGIDSKEIQSCIWSIQSWKRRKNQ